MRLSVMSYNIHFGIGADAGYDWERSCAVIAAAAPALAGLQEVTVSRPGSPPVNYCRQAAIRLGMHSAFAKTLDFSNGGEYGIAALSRIPFEPVTQLPLPVPAGAEPRTALIIRVKSETPFYFITTHFPFQGEFDGDDGCRLESARLIQRFLEEHGCFPAILVGDLNCGPDSPAVDFLRRAWDVMNDHGPATPTAKTGKYGWMQIDFICTYPKNAFRCRAFRIIDDLTASDHRPVLAELEPTGESGNR